MSIRYTLAVFGILLFNILAAFDGSHYYLRYQGNLLYSLILPLLTQGFFLGMSVFLIRDMVARCITNALKRQAPSVVVKTDDITEQELKQARRNFEEQWTRELALREFLLFSRKAPLHDAYQHHTSRTAAARERYEHAVLVAHAERDVTYQEADKKREAIYTEADRIREKAYADADKERDQKYAASDKAYERECDQADKSGDLSRHSRAYTTHNRVQSEAYTIHSRKSTMAYQEHARIQTEAYRNHNNAHTAAYSRCEQLLSAAWRAKDAEERASGEELECILEEYLAQHPEVLKQFFTGDERKVQKSHFTVTSTRMLTIPGLVERSTVVVHGEGNDATPEEISALVALLHDWLQIPAERDPYAQLRERGRNLLRSLIKMLN
ncbi:MAG: hypothetical protein HY437_02490 [Candidatus Magasanikbacteria bacterium]|nr:hypothetical protein [Candidatus Magasanikbacteria bacterium]